MRIILLKHPTRAFTLIEVVVTTAILAIITAAFYSGIASGFQLIDLSRQNLRGNQILLEKMETIRLYTWDQVNSNGFIPLTFTAPFFPAVNGAPASGITYYGTVTISDPPTDAAYSNSLKLVQVSVVWTNKNMPRQRSMETLVSQYGMQNYIY